jgi:molybdate/tungstate transport system substrate-binding protein
MVGRLQAGQLDAGFFYEVEAKAADIPTVTLGAIKLTNPYVVTVVSRAPHEAAAVAFVDYLLSARAAAILRREGLTVDRPAILSGPRSAVPSPLRSLVS